ncbi:MAG: 16S rRNA (adenine(1518)-N(6)/adenine(1519)-N(6))-dimethyltransferase RsmA [Candidatus Pacebacteria bacterium]|nr:16S rRNA (adenine(1518)-N(6)/adenine(1519)-N(6))-dimethyltransferase RsmA [Candidatus Paceibacterota bacterium]
MKHRRGARLGQHFLTGTWAAEKLVESALITSQDTVLEIGPGKGALTGEILKTGARVVAIEKDDALPEQLRSTFRSEIDAGRLQVIEGDVRDFDPEQCEPLAKGYILAANIPYYITGEIIRQFLTSSRQPSTMALLIQKEVADRILARDGKESILSLSVKAYGVPEIAAKVSKGNFTPPPQVDSAILVVRTISKDLFDQISEEHFFRVVRTGFSSKRKFLASNLSNEFERSTVVSALQSCGLSEKVRSEDVALEQWKQIALSLLR